MYGVLDLRWEEFVRLLGIRKIAIPENGCIKQTVPIMFALITLIILSVVSAYMIMIILWFKV